ncbi:MAG: hypothetical protein RLZZ335_254 [Bacteroidota bacterium]
MVAFLRVDILLGFSLRVVDGRLSSGRHPAVFFIKGSRWSPVNQKDQSASKVGHLWEWMINASRAVGGRRTRVTPIHIREP